MHSHWSCLLYLQVLQDSFDPHQLIGKLQHCPILSFSN
ncbi:unnamed protein product [Brassica rapa subsp. trilocularis]